jgi:hypothetical protein
VGNALRVGATLEASETNTILDTIQEALLATYQDRYAGFSMLEVFFEDLETFCLPQSDNSIVVVPSRASIGYGAALTCEDRIDVFLRTAQGIAILECVEIEEEDCDDHPIPGRARSLR